MIRLIILTSILLLIAGKAISQSIPGRTVRLNINLMEIQSVEIPENGEQANRAFPDQWLKILNKKNADVSIRNCKLSDLKISSPKTDKPHSNENFPKKFGVVQHARNEGDNRLAITIVQVYPR